MTPEPYLLAPRDCIECPHIMGWCEQYENERQNSPSIPRQRSINMATGRIALERQAEYQRVIDRHSDGCPGSIETYALSGGVAVRAVVCMSPSTIQEEGGREIAFIRRIAYEDWGEPENHNSPAPQSTS